MARQSVDDFMTSLAHTRRDEIEMLRGIIASADPSLTQQIKWNAPSFCHAGEDRITFRLQPGDRVELIFHRGAKPKPGAFSFADDSGLLRMVAADRGVATFRGVTEIEGQADSLRKLVTAWIAATAEQA